jgi:hypothetical protein
MKISRSLFGLLGVLLGCSLATPSRAQAPSPVPVLILAVDPLASELNQQPASFLVARIGPTTSELEVEYTVEGTASNGVDYVKIPETVTIPAGSSFANIEIVPIDDDLLEGTESVTLTLVASTNSPPPYVPSHPLAATAEISDDEKPPVDDTNVFVNIIAADPEAAEAASQDNTNTAIFSVTRTGPPIRPLQSFTMSKAPQLTARTTFSCPAKSSSPPASFPKQ